MMVPKKTQKCGNIGSPCMDEPVLGQGARGGGGGGGACHRIIHEAAIIHRAAWVLHCTRTIIRVAVVCSCWWHGAALLAGAEEPTGGYCMASSLGSRGRIQRPDCRIKNPRGQRTRAEAEACEYMAPGHSHGAWAQSQWNNCALNKGIVGSGGGSHRLQMVRTRHNPCRLPSGTSQSGLSWSQQRRTNI